MQVTLINYTQDAANLLLFTPQGLGKVVFQQVRRSVTVRCGLRA